MSHLVEAFLTKEEEEAIVEAIRQAELATSGEIRVHLETHTDLAPLDRAKELFHYLKMDNTKAENGVLIYVAVKDHQLAIYGDRGIHKQVGQDFWETTKDKMIAQFKKGNYKQGLIEGVLCAGERLAVFFPWEHGDTNELPDTITRS